MPLHPVLQRRCFSDPEPRVVLTSLPVRKDLWTLHGRCCTWPRFLCVVAYDKLEERVKSQDMHSWSDPPAKDLILLRALCRDGLRLIGLPESRYLGFGGLHTAQGQSALTRITMKAYSVSNASPSSFKFGLWQYVGWSWACWAHRPRRPRSPIAPVRGCKPHCDSSKRIRGSPVCEQMWQACRELQHVARAK